MLQKVRNWDELGDFSLAGYQCKSSSTPHRHYFREANVLSCEKIKGFHLWCQYFISFRQGRRKGNVLIKLATNQTEQQWRIYIVKFWTRAPPPGVQILSISCSFWENLAKSYVGAPPLGSWRPLLGEILDPPLNSQGVESTRTIFSLLDHYILPFYCLLFYIFSKFCFPSVWRSNVNGHNWLILNWQKLWIQIKGNIC